MYDIDFNVTAVDAIFDREMPGSKCYTNSELPSFFIFYINL